METITLQLKWTHRFEFAGYYAAIQQGFYTEVGLDVELAEGSHGLDVVEEVTSGRANFGIGSASLMIERSEGQPVVALASVFQHSPNVVLVRSDSDIRSPQQMVGKRYARGPSPSREFDAVLLGEGVGIEQVAVITHSSSLENFINGNTDAIAAYSTVQPYELDQAGIGYRVFLPTDYGVDFYSDILFTSEQEIEDDPERVAAFRDASLRGWQYAMDNPEEMIALIRSEYAPAVSEGQLLYEYESMRILILPDVVEIGHMNPGRWEHIKQTYIALGVVSADFDITGFLYGYEADTGWPMWVLYVGAGTALLAGTAILILIVFNRRLHAAIELRTADIRQVNVDLEAEVAGRHEAQTQLAELNVELEDRVQRRTAELAEANDDLLIAKNMAEEANRSKSDFLAKMSHEIRTPMNAIMGYTQLLRIDSKLDEGQREYTSIIEKGSENLMEIINHVLDMSQIEAGHVNLHFSPVDIVVLLNDLRAMLIEDALRKGLALEVEIGKDVATHVVTDKTRLTQILVNLLANAIKFTKVGFVRLSVTASPHGESSTCLQFTVTDSGPGIPEQDQKRIFEPFEQLESDSISAGGTGLGLSISYELAKLLGGSLTVASELGRGSEFKLELTTPIYRKPERTKSDSPPVAIYMDGAERVTALIVDDVAENRNLLKAIVESIGCKVVLADGGANAIKVCEAAMPDVALVDLRMPGTDGYDVLMRIDDLDPGNHCRTVAVTAGAFDTDEHKAKDAGFDDFIRKPYRLRDIRAVIERVMASRK